MNRRHTPDDDPCTCTDTQLCDSCRRARAYIRSLFLKPSGNPVPSEPLDETGDQYGD